MIIEKSGEPISMTLTTGQKLVFRYHINAVGTRAKLSPGETEEMLANLQRHFTDLLEKQVYASTAKSKA